MGNLFGIRRRAPVITAQDRAILQLKQQRDKIKIYQKKTEEDLEKNKDLALKLFQNGLKDRAMIVLRRKKYMEEVLSRTDKQLETLEQLVADIEYTQIEVSVVEGLKVGTEALKQLNSLMNVEDIQQMMDDSEEAAEKQKEISDILQRSSERYDEDELLEELERYKETPTSEPQQEVVGGEQQDTIETPTEVTQQPEVADKEQTIESKIEDLPSVPEELPKEELPSKKIRVEQKVRHLEEAQ